MSRWVRNTSISLHEDFWGPQNSNPFKARTKDDQGPKGLVGGCWCWKPLPGYSVPSCRNLQGQVQLYWRKSHGTRPQNRALWYASGKRIITILKEIEYGSMSILWPKNAVNVLRIAWDRILMNIIPFGLWAHLWSRAYSKHVVPQANGVNHKWLYDKSQQAFFSSTQYKIELSANPIFYPPFLADVAHIHVYMCSNYNHDL